LGSRVYYDVCSMQSFLRTVATATKFAAVATVRRNDCRYRYENSYSFILHAKYTLSYRIVHDY